MAAEAYPLQWPNGHPCTIPLTRGLVAVVDEADFELLSAFAWYAHKGRNTWYARTDIGGRKNRRRIYMHRMLLGVPMVDHMDGNGLNNRRANLRPASDSQNQSNRRKAAGTASDFKGVTWDAARATWLAQITRLGQHINLGRTDDELLAAARYDVAARALFGAFATSNLGVSWGFEDRGGDPAKMAELNAARQTALQELT